MAQQWSALAKTGKATVQLREDVLLLGWLLLGSADAISLPGTSQHKRLHMKHDITKTELWKCYEGVLPEWWNVGGDTEVNGLLFEMMDELQDLWGRTSDEDIEACNEILNRLTEKLGAAFIEDVKGISETGAAYVIDEVMDNHAA